MPDNLDPKLKRKNEGVRRRQMLMLLVGGVAAGVLMALAAVGLVSYSQSMANRVVPEYPAQAATAAPALQTEIRTHSNGFDLIRWSDHIGQVSRYRVALDQTPPLSLLSVVAISSFGAVRQMDAAAQPNRVLLVETNDMPQTGRAYVYQDDASIIEQWPEATAAAYSPDGTLYAIAHGIMVETYRSDTHEWTGRFFNTYANTAAVERLAFSPDNQWVAIQTQAGLAVYAANVQDPRPQWQYTLTNTPVYDLTFAPDNRVVVAYDWWVVLYDRQGGSQAKYDLPADSGTPNNIAVSTDGKWLATTGTSKTYVWRLDDGGALSPDENATTPRALVADVLSPLAVGFLPDSALMVVADASNALRIWDVERMEIVAKAG